MNVNDQVLGAIRSGDLKTLSAILKEHPFPSEYVELISQVNIDTYRVIMSHYTADTIPWSLVDEMWQRKIQSPRDTTKWEVVEYIITPHYLTLNEEDIISLSERLRSEDIQQYYLYPVKKCDHIAMIRCGFLPIYKMENVKTNQFLRYMKTNPEDRSSDWFQHSMSFWSSGRLDGYTEMLPYSPVWLWRSTKYWIERAEISSSSFPLVFTAPHLLYPSGRPKTSMMAFYTATNNVISKNQRRLVLSNESLSVYEVKIKDTIFHAIPVTRYSEGMSRGLFYGERKEGVCGVFYYSEPTSNTMLLYKKEHSMTFFNKIDAAIKMGLINIDSDPSHYDQILLDHISGKIHPKLLLTQSEANNITGLDEAVSDDEPQYAGVKIGLYGYEDQYDQSICNGARRKMIDVVVLTNMVGSFQTVTEILDTRSVGDSYASLVYMTD